MTRPEKLIKIPDPKYDVEIDFGGIKDGIPDDEVAKNWQGLLDDVSYDRDRWMITKTRVDTVEAKSLKNKRSELLEGPDEFDYTTEGELPRNVLENKFKVEIMNIASGLLTEAGFGSMLKGVLYSVMMDHVRKKIFSDKPLSEAAVEDIEFALYIIPEIRRNFSKPIVAGILGAKL